MRTAETKTINREPTARLGRIEKEWHSRHKLVYMVSDRWGNYLLMSQKLQPLAEYINEKIAKDNTDHVSVPGLYSGRISSGKYKYRWKVDHLSLDTTPAVYESSRADFQTALIFGYPSCYKIEAS